MPLQIDGVRITSGTTCRLQIDKASVAEGEFLVVIGHNGAGKSTLLDAIAGILAPSEGHISLHAPEAVSPADSNRLGYLYQSPETSLFGMTVLEEFSISLQTPTRDLAADWNLVQSRHLEPVGLGHVHPHDMPARWSTGMQRKLAFALAFARNPRWLLLDEPTSGLDAKGRSALLTRLQHHSAQGNSIIVATHHLDDFLPLATRVWLFEAGHILFDGTAGALYKQPDLLVQAGVGLPPSLRLQIAFKEAGFIDEVAIRTPQRLATDVIDTKMPEPILADKRMMDVDAVPAESDAPSLTAVTEAPNDIDVRFRWLGVTALTLAIAVTHRPTAIALSVVVTGIVLVWLHARPRRILQWSLAWASFALITSMIAGIQFGHPSGKFVSFQVTTALSNVVSILPYWCFLQLGQVLITTSSPFQVGAMLDRLLKSARCPIRVRRLVALVATLVYRFIPAIARMYQGQLRAYQARTLGRKRRRFGWMHIAHVLTPFVIRLITYGETTSEAMTVRGLFSRPFPGGAFEQRAATTRDWIFASFGVTGAAVIAALMWL